MRYNAVVARMRDRTRFPPGSWQALHPEAGQKEPYKGSFTEVVTWEAKFRKANPTLTEKNGWSLDPEAIANDVDTYNAQRMIAGGFLHFVDMEGEHAPSPPGGVRRSRLAGLAAVADSTVTGLAIYRELFTVGKPVAKEEAERRAAICVQCPLNERVTLKSRFLDAVAKPLSELLGAMKSIDLTTSHDKELGVCSACNCPMRVKTWVELSLIRKHLKPDQEAALDPRCWILPANVVP